VTVLTFFQGSLLNPPDAPNTVFGTAAPQLLAVAPTFNHGWMQANFSNASNRMVVDHDTVQDLEGETPIVDAESTLAACFNNAPYIARNVGPLDGASTWLHPETRLVYANPFFPVNDTDVGGAAGCADTVIAVPVVNDNGAYFIQGLPTLNLAGIQGAGSGVSTARFGETLEGRYLRQATFGMDTNADGAGPGGTNLWSLGAAPVAIYD